MNKNSFRALLFQKNFDSCSKIIQSKVSTSDLIQIINDLIFVSASIDLPPKEKTHPIAVINSIKNFISDDRQKPSKLLLEYGVKYLIKFEFRLDDKKFLSKIIRMGAGEIVFTGDLEDACQDSNWEEAKILVAKLFLASDQSRATLDTLVELALQDPTQNSLFCFHLLRAYQFQELKEDNWTFISCIFDILSKKEMPKPHRYEKIDIEQFQNGMFFKSDPILFSSVLRLWNGDYVRIRGYQRELSHWIKKNSITNKNQNFLTSKNIENSFIVPNFIKKAEAVVTRKNKIKNIAADLVDLEAFRFLYRKKSKEEKDYIYHLISKIVQ
jgi:hypothetical protein